MNYLLNYTGDSANNDDVGGSKFKLFSLIKNTIFKDTSVDEFKNIYLDKVSNEYDGMGKYKVTGISADDLTEDLKSTNNVKINSILSNFRINVINDNNIQKPAIFYENGNKTEQVLIENITNNSLNNAYSEDEIKHYFTIAKHIHYFYEQIKERKNDFNNEINKYKSLRWISFYPYQSFYYTVTTASTIGFGDISPVGSLPKMNFIMFALFVVIFLAYEIINVSDE
jgi:hypothetical protein